MTGKELVTNGLKIISRKKKLKYVKSIQFNCVFTILIIIETDKTGNETHQCSQRVRCNKKFDVRWFHCSNVSQPLIYQHLKAVVSTDGTRLCVCQACHSWARQQLKRSELDSPLLDKRKTGRKVCKIDGCFQPMHRSTETDDDGMPNGLCS